MVNYITGKDASKSLYTSGDGVDIKPDDSINVDKTVVRTFGEQIIAGDKTFTGNISAATFTTTTELDVKDQMIKINSGNTSNDISDSGLYSEYNDGTGVKYTGIIRKATNGKYYLFTHNPNEPLMSLDVTNLQLANLKVKDPTDNDDAATKNYVDNAITGGIGGFVDLTSNQTIAGVKEFTDQVIVPDMNASGVTVDSRNVINLGYAEDRYLVKANGGLDQTIHTDVVCNGTFKLNNEPVDYDDVVNKQYLDNYYLSEQQINNTYVRSDGGTVTGNLTIEDTKNYDENGWALNPYTGIERKIDFVGDALNKWTGTGPVLQPLARMSLTYDKNKDAINKSGAQGAGQLSFYTRGASNDATIENLIERMTINSDGNVGIGTSTPQALLSMFKNISGDTDLLSIKTNSGGVTDSLFKVSAKGSPETCILNMGDAFQNGNDDNYKLQLNSNGNTYFNGGNVGIGTDNPQYKLDVNGDIGVNGNLYSNQNSIRLNPNKDYTDAYFNLQTQSGTTGTGVIDFWIYSNFGLLSTRSGQTLALNPNNHYNSGNVGIGTTIPQYKLEVDGEVGVKNHQIKNVADPTENGDAVNKNYVDTQISNVSGGTNKIYKEYVNYGNLTIPDNQAFAVIDLSSEFSAISGGTNYLVTVSWSLQAPAGSYIFSFEPFMQTENSSFLTGNGRTSGTMVDKDGFNHFTVTGSLTRQLTSLSNFVLECWTHTVGGSSISNASGFVSVTIEKLN